MASLPDRGSAAESQHGLLSDIGWLVLAVLVFGGLAVLEPLFIDVTPTTGTVLGSLGVGVPLGVGLVYLALESERARPVRRDVRYRFVAVFAFIVGTQVLLRFATTWTVLVTLAASLTAIPTRLYLYYRHPA